MTTIEHLPQVKPLDGEWDWQRFAACRGMDSAAFFHSTSDGISRHNRIKAAKAVCKTCPVIQQCLDHALQPREPYGVWGGQSEDERARMLGVECLLYPAPRKRR